MARHPITNAQFATFLDAGGYQNPDYFIPRIWEWLQKNQKECPDLWMHKDWNADLQPVVGVMWYEAIAFCQWLSDQSGEHITLPTGQQWEYAAFGGSSLQFPWGDEWDCSRCICSVKPCKHTTTQPVNACEGAGDSPFGICNMAGNVWEWCLNTSDTQAFNAHDTHPRLMRGGSFQDHMQFMFTAETNSMAYPGSSNNSIGFRLIRVES